MPSASDCIPGVRRSRQVAQYTALVDIMFATIGVFVIVFVLQDLETPSDLKPARYDALVVCGADQRISLYTGSGESPPATARSFAPEEIETLLAEALAGQGRILVALGRECHEARNGASPPGDELRELERRLGTRAGKGPEALTLFEFAPLGSARSDLDALLQLFQESSRVTP